MKAKFFVFTLASLSLLWSVTGCAQMFSKNKTRFEWLTTESAPNNFPMRVIRGTLYYHNEKGGLYIPEAASFSSGWGNGTSRHVVGEDFKALPDRLDIRFFSFTENKLYRGSFDLPYEKILAWFKSGVAKNREGIPYPQNPTFRTVMVGMAPGGRVAVWVAGQEVREVFFGQAEQYEDDLVNTLGNPIRDRDAYVQRMLESDVEADVLNDIRKNGVPTDRWVKYRKRYHWLPTFVDAQRPNYMNVAFFNGEYYRLNYPISEVVQKEDRAAPLLLSFSYLVDGKPMQGGVTVRFNDEELYAAFDRLSASGETMQIELDPALPRSATKVRVFTSKESIQLTKFTVDEK